MELKTNAFRARFAPEANNFVSLVNLATGDCCFSKRMRNFFRKNEKSVLQFCNKKPKRKGRLQRVEKSL